MGDILELGHTGVMVRDLVLCRDFYASILGLRVTDEDLDRGLVFLSSRPEVEHHELVLQSGRADDRSTVQQISWLVGSIGALQRFRARFEAEGVAIDRIVTHGNAVGIYFFDPEGNRNEVYVRTGDDTPQPFARPIALDGAEENILAESRRLAADRQIS